MELNAQKELVLLCREYSIRMADQMGVRGPNVILRQEGAAGGGAGGFARAIASVGMLVSGMAPTTGGGGVTLSISADLMAMVPALGNWRQQE